MKKNGSNNKILGGVITSIKNLIALMLLLGSLAAPQSRGATVANCLVDGEVWNSTGSPYLVNCDVTVYSLIIQPGVEVRFLSNYVFMVEGILKVEGAAAPNQVVFTTTNAAVGWQGIWFVDSLPGSFFNNCVIQYSKNSGVRITNSPPVGGGVPTFTNCVFSGNSSPTYGGAIDATLRSGDLILDNCLILLNTSASYGGGINAIVNNGTLKMVHSTIVS